MGKPGLFYINRRIKNPFFKNQNPTKVNHSFQNQTSRQQMSRTEPSRISELQKQDNIHLRAAALTEAFVGRRQTLTRGAIDADG